MMHALVVDDSKAIRAVVGNILREIGFDVSEAGNGREALDRMRQSRKTDLALVDWNMPEMNGYDFLCAVRSDPGYRETPLVMITTETEVEQMCRALEAGANEYLMKPFTREALLEKLALLGMVPE